MNIMAQIISESIFILTLCSKYQIHIHSCWIKSEDGAIAAFIVPIVAITLVELSFNWQCNYVILFTDKLCIFSDYFESTLCKQTNITSVYCQRYSKVH